MSRSSEETASARVFGQHALKMITHCDITSP
jgi:hypothetical protein